MNPHATCMQGKRASDATMAAAIERLTADIETVQGIPFGELDSLGAVADAAVNKGAGRAMLDRFSSRCEEAQRSFGVTVRTVPVGPTGKVLWPTKIVNIDFSAVVHQEFEESRVGAILTAVLFVPIIKPDRQRVEEWSFGAPAMWTPQALDRNQLAHDYEETRKLVRAGLADSLSSSSRHGQGKWLMPKTSGRNSSDIVTYLHAGDQVRVRRRAFFLREVLTARLLVGSVRPVVADPHEGGDTQVSRADLDEALRSLLGK
jgi:DNA mismatch repair protein MutH